jgi:hypothetical protein
MKKTGFSPLRGWMIRKHPQGFSDAGLKLAPQKTPKGPGFRSFLRTFSSLSPHFFTTLFSIFWGEFSLFEKYFFTKRWRIEFFTILSKNIFQKWNIEGDNPTFQLFRPFLRTFELFFNFLSGVCTISKIFFYEKIENWEFSTMLSKHIWKILNIK